MSGRRDAVRLDPAFLAGVALLVSLAGGCTLGPDYERPPVTTPEQWRETTAVQTSIANVAWWELFQDEQLRGLVDTALAENRDLRIAVERIEEARALYGFTRSDLYPQVNATAQAGALRFSDAGLTHTPETLRDQDNTKAIYALGASLYWELDFFGRIRRATEAQKAEMLATQEAHRAVALTLVSEVARAYIELRDLDRRLEIARRTLDSRQEYVGLARDRFEGGVTSEVDWRQAEAEFFRVQAFVYEMEKLVVQKENEISVLVGHNPGAVPRGRTLDQQPIPPEVPAGLPAEILERRPDVREAEERLHAATARIGEAQAARYPQISLTGSFGVASTELDELLDSNSQNWNLFANLLQPIFNFGKNKRRVEIRESQTRQAVYEYESSLLRALREVEDSLIGLEKTGQQRGAQRDRVGAERRVLDLAETRYRGGVAAYLEVLDAQRSLFNAEIDETMTISEHVISLIQLYKALGGGWPVAPEGGETAAGVAPTTHGG
jgi:multidrug efflux system outer membrane protein